jgi:serum response factor
MDDNDRSSVSDNDSVHSPQSRNEAISSIHAPSSDDKPKPAPGKKTRGRVKIEMQYIQNKLRRYTTFSKRKSGIMKKVSRCSVTSKSQRRFAL